MFKTGIVDVCLSWDIIVEVRIKNSSPLTDMTFLVEVELEDTRQENMTLRWQNGAISNFEYLMYLNRLVKLML